MRVVSTLLLVLLLFLGVLFINRQHPEEVHFEEYLPSDTLFYLHQKNGVETFRKFKESTLGKTVRGMDLHKIGHDIGLAPDLLEDIDEAVRKTNVLQEDRLIRALIGKNCSLALFPKRKWSDGISTFEQYLQTHSLLISKPRVNISILDFITTYYGGKYKVESVPYGKYTIKRFISDDSRVSVVFTEGYLMASYEERVLREALDIYDYPDKSLLGQKQFQTVRNRLAGSDRMVFFSFSEARKMTDFWANHIRSVHQKAFLDEISDLKGFTVAGYGAWRGDSGGNVITDRVLVGMERENLLPLTGKMLAIAPEVNETLPFVVDDVFFYYWSNTINMGLLWDMYRKNSKISEESFENLNRQVKDVTKSEIPQILSMFDNNISILVRKSQLSQFVPIPDFAVIVKLKDRPGMEKLLQEAMEELDISIQSRKYQTIKYNYWGLYPLESLQPVYSIYKGYLIVANTLDIFKTIVDSASYKDLLVLSPDFAPIDPGLNKQSNSVCYINQAVLLGELQELVSWGGTMLAIQDRQAAAKSKVLIDEFINPLLQGFSMYEKSSSRTYIEEDWIITDLSTKLTH